MPVSLHVPDGSDTPLPTLVHVPSEPGMAQLWHCPHAAEPQQTFSTQLPVSHWPPAVHSEPWAFFTSQCEVVVLQYDVGTQSLSLPQVVLQALTPSHLYGAQDSVVTEQVPEVPQVAASVCTVLCAGHEAAAQTVLAAYFWQPPEPSHLPVLPHVEAVSGGQKAAGAVVPAGASVQVPVPERLQTWQAGQLAEPQHTPSTHIPDVH